MTLFTDDPLEGAMNDFLENIVGLQGDDLAAYNDLEFYSRYVIGYGDPSYSNNSRMIKRIYERLQHSEESNFLILGPRGSAKSTSVTVTYQTWKMGRNRLIRFLLLCASIEAQGLGFSRQIDQILTGNQRYINIFGELKPPIPQKWTETEKIIQRVEPPGGMKDPTLAVVGLNSNVPSKRADEIILDDVVTPDNAYSETQRKKVIAFVFQAIYPILVPRGRFIVIGSRWDNRDLYATIAAMWGLEFPGYEDVNLAEVKKLAELKSPASGVNIEELVIG